MELNIRPRITVETTVNKGMEKAWEFWTRPEHITNWNYASDEWHSPSAVNDLRPGGTFSYRMEAKDGSFGFDFGGTYDEVKQGEGIQYTLGDGRKVEVLFQPLGEATRITEVFEAEDENTLDMQRFGWQAILDNFKKYTERDLSL
jgi:uncharacterized protein YndB with AHSA1/START domain